MRHLLLLLSVLSYPVFSAPVAIDTSHIDDSGEQKVGVGITFSTAQRPFKGVNNQTTALPYLSLRYNGFYIEGVNAGYTVVRDKSYRLDVLLTPRFYEVKESFANNNELQGIGEKKPTLFLGASAQFNARPFLIRTQVLADVKESNGVELIAKISHRIALSESLSIIPSIGITWQNSSLVDHFYGVQKNEASVNNPFYEADATLNYNTSITLSWKLNKHVEMLGFVKYKIFGDEITDSPIVDEQAVLLGALGVIYRF